MTIETPTNGHHLVEDETAAGHQFDDTTPWPTSGRLEHITIAAPNFGLMQVHLIGTAPYLQCAFPEKAKADMEKKQRAGSTAEAPKTRRAARDFDAAFEGAKHVSEEGWYGIPASAFRTAMIDACRVAGYQMVKAKMSVFIVPDGMDRFEPVPLVRLGSDEEPERTQMVGRNTTGVADLRIRPLWRRWWVDLRIRYDADQFKPGDLLNLLARAGMQVGVGEGRPLSKRSNGIGMGTFEVGDAEILR